MKVQCKIGAGWEKQWAFKSLSEAETNLVVVMVFPYPVAAPLRFKSQSMVTPFHLPDKEDNDKDGAIGT